MSVPSLAQQQFFVSEMTSLRQQLVQMEADYTEALDTIWMLLAATLVFFMHAGFSLLEAGSVRFKNAQNILAKNLIVVTVGFLCWYVMGWPLAYGVVQDPNRFSGGTQFVMDGFFDDKKLLRNWFFQGAFAATAGTIVSGAMAERTQLKGFVIFIVLMTSFIYPIVVYWGWSGEGFLNFQGKSEFGNSFMDFAGSGLVHMVGGFSALVGSIIVGPRSGHFEGEPDAEFDGHNVPFCVMGTFFLWFGWYGFNPGSTLSMSSLASAHDASLVACNTTLAPCMGGLLVFALRAKVVAPKCLDVGGFCNGILAGLVSITAGCNAVEPWEALIIGLIGGALYQGASMLLVRFQIDDVVDAFPVHGVCGLWGVISLGFFGSDNAGGNGALHGHQGHQLWTQVMGSFIIAVWVVFLSFLIFFPLRLLGMLRLSDDFQKQGADLIEHSPPKAYNQNAAPESRL